MDPELVGLASSAATAVVSAMATEAWQAVRGRIARLLGRGDQRAEQMALETLDEDAASLPVGADAQELRRDLTTAWTARMRDLLRSDPDAAGGLREFVAEFSAQVSATGGGVAAGRDMYIQAAQGGVAAGTIQGSVTMSYPSPPGTEQA